MEAPKPVIPGSARGIAIPMELVRQFKEEIRIVPVIRSGMIMIPDPMLNQLDAQKLKEQMFMPFLVTTAISTALPTPTFPVTIMFRRSRMLRAFTLDTLSKAVRVFTLP
jgi:hypothetical protein